MSSFKELNIFPKTPPSSYDQSLISSIAAKNVENAVNRNISTGFLTRGPIYDIKNNPQVEIPAGSIIIDSSAAGHYVKIQGPLRGNVEGLTFSISEDQPLELPYPGDGSNDSPGIWLLEIYSKKVSDGDAYPVDGLEGSLTQDTANLKNPYMSIAVSQRTQVRTKLTFVAQPNVFSNTISVSTSSEGLVYSVKENGRYLKATNGSDAFYALPLVFVNYRGSDVLANRKGQNLVPLSLDSKYCDVVYYDDIQDIRPAADAHSSLYLVAQTLAHNLMSKGFDSDIASLSLNETEQSVSAPGTHLFKQAYLTNSDANKAKLSAVTINMVYSSSQEHLESQSSFLDLTNITSFTADNVMLSRSTEAGLLSPNRSISVVSNKIRISTNGLTPPTTMVDGSVYAVTFTPNISGDVSTKSAMLPLNRVVSYFNSSLSTGNNSFFAPVTVPDNGAFALPVPGTPISSPHLIQVYSRAHAENYPGTVYVLNTSATDGAVSFRLKKDITLFDSTVTLTPFIRTVFQLWGAYSNEVYSLDLNNTNVSLDSGNNEYVYNLQLSQSFSGTVTVQIYVEGDFPIVDDRGNILDAMRVSTHDITSGQVAFDRGASEGVFAVSTLRLEDKPLAWNPTTGAFTFVKVGDQFAANANGFFRTGATQSAATIKDVNDVNVSGQKILVMRAFNAYSSLTTVVHRYAYQSSGTENIGSLSIIASIGSALHPGSRDPGMALPGYKVLPSASSLSYTFGQTNTRSTFVAYRDNYLQGELTLAAPGTVTLVGGALTYRMPNGWGDIVFEKEVSAGYETEKLFYLVADGKGEAKLLVGGHGGGGAANWSWVVFDLKGKPLARYW